ncbi:MAG: hypothetical protein ABIX01_02090 [Chitinophagaceae bacterium]
MTTGKKILLVQLYSNGDCLYATTVARQIKQDFPGCHLTWAISAFCKEIIDLNPYVDDVVVIDTVPKDDIPAFRNFKKLVCQQKKEGLFDEVFITQTADTNIAFYDGTIRGSIFKAYPTPITVPIAPVLVLSNDEMARAAAFSEEHHLTGYEKVVLFEYAPQSGQSAISKDFSIIVAEGIVSEPSTAIILSSANRVLHKNPAIIDGSYLTLRETAALTHYCNLLLGSSSGITWISSSIAAKQLPMVQMLNEYANFGNPVSLDFERFNIPVDGLIELVKFDSTKIINCVQQALQCFPEAREKYNQVPAVHFKTCRRIVYMLLCYLEFGALARYIRLNGKTFGHPLAFYIEVLIGFITFPFKLIRNKFIKVMRR